MGLFTKKAHPNKECAFVLLLMAEPNPMQILRMQEKVALLMLRLQGQLGGFGRLLF